MLGAFLTALPVVAVIAPVTWRCFTDPLITPNTNFKCSVVDVPLRRRFSSTTRAT
jgi:peptidoglycan/LPS O-acetylase OafA/YrhL